MVWITGPEPEVRCCDLVHLERECFNPQCVEDNGRPMIWHAAPYCRFCRGEGELCNPDATSMDTGDDTEPEE